MAGSEDVVCRFPKTYKHADPPQGFLGRHEGAVSMQAFNTRLPVLRSWSAEYCGGRKRFAAVFIVRTQARSNQSLTNALEALGGSSAGNVSLTRMGPGITKSTLHVRRQSKLQRGSIGPNKPS